MGGLPYERGGGALFSFRGCKFRILVSLRGRTETLTISATKVSFRFVREEVDEEQNNRSFDVNDLVVIKVTKRS